MTDFTQVPDSLTIIRTILAFVVFCFLPGYFISSAARQTKHLSAFIKESLPQALFESIFISILVLGFCSVLVVFTVGFGPLSIFAVESLATILAFMYWRGNSK